MSDDPRPSRPEVFRAIATADAATGVESQLATSSLALPPVSLEKGRDIHFATTQEFWQAILSERVRARRVVSLHNVLLSEWFPRSPGLYYTEQAAWERAEAIDRDLDLTPEQESMYQGSFPPDPVIYDIYGKMSMLRGGIGCIRLKERLTAEGPLFFMSASTGLSADRGVPIALTPDDYERCIDEVTERGVLPCTLTGRLVFLPDEFISLYGGYSGVPRLYLLVTDIVPAHSPAVLEAGQPLASAAVLFRADDPWPAISAAFVYFVPGRRGTLAQRLPWLDYYVSMLHGGTVLTDFDEQMTRFPNAVFSLQKVASGRLAASEITDVADLLGVDDSHIQSLMIRQQQYGRSLYNIRIKIGEVHVGDVFKDIGPGTVIVNRSTLTNALNRVEADYSAETAQALQELVGAVEGAGQPQAIDSLNALSEELDKPQPSKSRLKVWLDAITAALPEVAAVATAVAKVAQLIL
jgi:hypothetical protein